MAAELPTCGRCNKPIAPVAYVDHSGATREYPPYWEHGERERVFLHQDCVPPWRAERAVKLARSAATLRVSSVFSRVPAWSHARVNTPEFGKLCRTPKLRALAESWTFNDGSRLLLGPSGIGKSTATIALVRRLCLEAIEAEVRAAGDELDQRLDDLGQERRVRTSALIQAEGIVWTSARILAAARREHGFGSGAPEIVKLAASASLLIIDEMGSELDDRDGDLLAVIDARYNDGEPTIATSGLQPTEFVGRYGSAFLRRLSDREIGAELIR